MALDSVELSSASGGIGRRPAGRFGFIPHRVSRTTSGAVVAGATAIRRVVVRVDDYLSRQHGVRPFCSDPLCLLRFSPLIVTHPAMFSDGTVIGSGALVADLHLWNEHIPPMPKGGPDFIWARRVSDQMRRSLHELARNFAMMPELENAQACRARTNFLGHGRSSESLSRVIERFGFEDVDEGSPAMPMRVHDLFENLLIAALVWTHNPEALRSDKCIRVRRPVWMLRGNLLGQYGGQ